MTKLPVYELKFALEGRVDEMQDPLPPVTHVRFLRDYLSTDDMILMYELTGGDLEDIETNQVKMFKIARALLPQMTDLSDADTGMLKASDFIGLIGILGPFIEF